MKKQRKYSDAWMGYEDVRTGVRSGAGLSVAQAKRAEKDKLRNGAFLGEDFPYKMYYLKSSEALDQWMAKVKKKVQKNK